MLRDLTERVVVASKGRFDRAISAADRARQALPCAGSISMDEFVDATTDMWDIPAESATRVGHPAPFPVELPRRLIELYTYRGDLVLDPFMGSGSTAVAAVRTGRAYVGFDTDAGYVARARARVAAERAEEQGGRTAPGARHIVVPAVQKRAGKGAGQSADPDRITTAFRQGRKAREVARLVLEVAGFAGIEENVSLRDLGLELAFRARDGNGERWLFDLAGAFSVTRPGLRRADNIWRVLGKAAVLQAAAGRPAGAPRRLGPLVVLTTDAPIASTPAGRALAVAVDRSAGPIHDVIELTDPVALARLSSYAASAPPAP